MSTNTDNSDEPERGPNGYYYVDMDRSELGTWDSGEHRMTLIREDGERLTVNLEHNDLRAIRDAADHHLEHAEEEGLVESDNSSDTGGGAD